MNTWGKENTGHDSKLFDIGRDLQNATNINAVREALKDLEKILNLMEKEEARKRLASLA